MKPIVSVVYAYYNTPVEIIQSLRTIKEAVEHSSYEVIVVDNASIKLIPRSVKEDHKIKIIRNDKNCGYGAALNQGVKITKGKYLILANPDTEFIDGSINLMIERIESNAKIGVLGPKVMSKKGAILQSISNMPFLPDALVIFSFLKKLWPFNLVYKKYHRTNFSRNIEQEVEVVSGVCMVVKKSVFEKVGGFDERFFMYFEEADFCYRIKQLGYQIVYYPKARIIHLVGRSTADKKWIQRTFEQSRFKFFQKYHGTFLALLTEGILRFLAPNLILFTILAISAILNLHKLAELMAFIGDQGWFYLSARDLLLTGNITLVGIASSHPWLHQGPLWTYILALIFWIFKFNPVAPAYFTAVLDVVTVFLMYKIGSELFSKRVGLIAAVLFATSPLVIIHSRTPYHTSVIPFFILLFIYSLYKWVKGNSFYFPLVILFLAILYNLELFTVVLWFVLLTVLVFGIWRKEKWLFKIINKKILLFSVATFTVPMLPILIYDVQNGFPQTVKFIAWIGYRIIVFFGFPSIHENVISESISSFITISVSYIRRLIFLPNETVAVFIFILSLGFFFWRIYLLKKKLNASYTILGLFIIISLLGYFINKTPSEAYIPVFFPLIIFVVALLFEDLIKVRFLKMPSILILVIILSSNVYSLISQNYLVKKGYSFKDRLNTSKQIVKTTNGREYNLFGKGEGSQFKSFTMNYEYLTWWLGHGPSQKNEKIRFTIQEDR